MGPGFCPFCTRKMGFKLAVMIFVFAFVLLGMGFRAKLE